MPLLRYAQPRWSWWRHGMEMISLSLTREIPAQKSNHAERGFLLLLSQTNFWKNDQVASDLGHPDSHVISL